MALESYRELKVWQQGMNLAEMCFHLTRPFPREEQFGMTSQIRRSAASIPANIAEGYGRGHRNEYCQFLRIAQGSLNELETHLLLSVRVGLTSEETVTPVLECCNEIGRMLGALVRSLRPPVPNPIP
jgi:four helix bundle protein